MICTIIIFWFQFQIFQGNANTYKEAIQKLVPPIIASRIRFIPHSLHLRTICLRTEVYGCIFNGEYFLFTLSHLFCYMTNIKILLIELGGLYTCDRYCNFFLWNKKVLECRKYQKFNKIWRRVKTFSIISGPGGTKKYSHWETREY